MNKYDPHKHRRRSIRLDGWDYRAAGAYFVTICTHQRQHLFAHAAYHEVAAQALRRVPSQPHAAHVDLDTWVVMPNHVHAIFVFGQDDDLAPTTEGFHNAAAGSLGVLVARYKAEVTRRINQLRRTPGGKVWQRGYYERIIRDEEEWRATQTYIRQNPARWAADQENLDGLVARMTKRP